MNKSLVIAGAVSIIVSGAFVVDGFFKEIEELKSENQELHSLYSESNIKVKEYEQAISIKDSKINEFEQKILNLEQKIVELEKQKSTVKSSRSAGRETLLGSNFDMTWYTGDSITASGTRPKEGHSVAITRGLVPKGTKLKIVLPNGETYYRVADDVTGQKGDRLSNNGLLVDMFVDSKSGIDSRGRVTGVEVYALY